MVDRGVSSRARHGVVGIEEIDRCPHCGAEATLFKRGEFERVNWLHLFLLGLIKLGLAGQVRRW